MTKLTQRLNHRLIESALLKRIPNDSLQLQDEVMLAAINKQTPLTRTQADLLLNSPLTLLRFKHLCQQLKQQQNAPKWTGSEGLLLAAASEQDIRTLSTSDKLWALHFLPDAEGRFNLILKCLLDDDILEQLLESEQIIEVTDNKGNLICRGQLDEAGELEAQWPFALSPRHYFQQIGEGFKVRPAS